ncbi:bifunctional RNase H/acid phosphatase [Oerskovia flava]|uniref:bifunctional RNase H/acid phosphatase n=1 Tax=Oerskovia flava TaxID=2986422 RepID=UPI00223EB483|nr:bifunctional RNase H/acid phosphatase [Oerskovia sp. JB1-3-2]
MGAQRFSTLVVEADGGSRGNPGPAGFGALVRDGLGGRVLAERAGFLGTTTNNVAEYTGLVAGLRAAAEIDPDARVQVRMDSKLVVEQMSGRWQIKHEDMRRLAREAAAVLPSSQVDYTWIPRAENSAADALANEAMDTREQIARDLWRESAGGPPAEQEPVPTTRPHGARVRFDGHEPLTIVLVRHGQTPLTVAGAYSGSSVPGPSLTSRGRIQAAQAADLVHRIGREVWPDLPRPSAIVASPMVRAQETAAAVGRRVGLPVTTDARFAEVDFGRWEGLTSDQIAERWPGEPEQFLMTGTVRAPGGESVADVGERVVAGLRDLVAQGVGRTVVVVGHAVQVRAAVGRALDAPPERWSGLRIPPGSVSILRWWEDGLTEATVVGCPSDL